MNFTTAMRLRLMDWVAGGLRTKAVSLRESFAGFDQSAFPWSYTGSANSLQQTAVYACIDVLSKDVAKLPINVYRNRSDGGRDQQPNHPVAKLLRRPNSWQTRFDFIRYLVASLQLNGNSYNVIIRPGGDLRRIIPVYPYRCQMYMSVEGEIFYGVSRNSGFESTQLSPQPFYVPARDMLHIKGLSVDGFRGMSPLEIARNAITMTQAMEKHGLNLFRKGARPGGVLEAPHSLTDKAIKNIKQSWEESVGGDDSGGIAVLEEGVKYNALGLDSVDLQYIENRKFQIEEIARVFGVPLYRIGDLSRATWSNVENLSRDYVDNTLLPLLENIEAALDVAFDLAPEFGAEFDVSRLLRADAAGRFSTYAIGRQWGIYNSNEIRSKEGENPYEGGEKYWAPVNMTEAKKIGETPPPPPTPVPEPKPAAPAELTDQQAKALVDMASKGLL